MRKIHLIVVCLALLLLTACSPVTKVSGIVLDQNNVPIENVKIKVFGKSTDQKNNLEYLTKSDGKYDFGEIYVSSELPVEIKLLVTKEGYKPFTRDLKYGEDNIDKIYLESESGGK